MVVTLDPIATIEQASSGTTGGSKEFDSFIDGSTDIDCTRINATGIGLVSLA